MSLGHGKNTAVYLNGRNQSPYARSVDLQLSAEVHETTAMGDDTVTRIGGLFDSKVGLAGMYEGSVAPGVYAMLRAAFSSANVALLAVWLLGEAAIGAVGLAFRARLAGHSVEMPHDNLVTFDANFQGYKDAELIESIHPLAAETATGNGTALDGGAATTNGGAFWVHATAFTGTSITLTVEDSADNSTFATIATFTAISAAGTSERIEIAGNIRRYTRVVRAGTFTTCTFSVGQSRF